MDELQEQTPMLVVVPSLDDAQQYLTRDGDVWVSNGPRIFTQFKINKAKGAPLHCAVAAQRI
jgi:hypothetical protein